MFSTVVKDLTELEGEVQKAVEQKFDLKQQLLGKGKNQAQVIMVGPVVVADTESVREMLRAIILEQKPEEGFTEPLEYLMAKLLKGLPAPRWKNFRDLACKIARELTITNKDAALYLGVSERTVRNYRKQEKAVKEIEG